MPEFENRSIICFAPSDWWGMNPSCTVHIVKRLARRNKVLYINPFSSDLLGVKKGKRKGLAQRIKRKLNSLAKWLRKPQENLYVFSPVFLPFQGNKVIDSLNNFLLICQIKFACFLAGIRKPVLWLENVRAADLINKFGNSPKIYHVSDLFGNDGYISNKDIQRQRENKIAESSDLIICVSKKLYEIYKAKHDNVHYLPHGVDFEIFREAARLNEPLDEFAHISNPIAGYFGTLTDSNDIELWQYCAENLPNVSFILAGRVTGGDYSKLQKMKNVYMPGFVDYKKVPALCAMFDVCMLNWKQSPWIESCNPLKMFEYMASGKPVVSVPIEQARQFGELVSIASDKQQFCQMLRNEIENDTPERSQRRIEIAAQYDWDNQYEKLSHLLKEICDGE